MSEAWKRNLAVPFFTQRDNTYIWQQVANEIIFDDEDTSKIKYNIGDKFGPKYPMAWRSCNVTSLCMLLHYWGITNKTPNQIIEEVYSNTEWNWSTSDTGYKVLEYWENLKTIAEHYISLTAEGESFCVHREEGTKLSISLLQEQIGKGCPVMISTGLGANFKSNKDKDGNLINEGYKRSGHIVVVRGFTDKGDVILNDPYGIPVENDNRIRQTGTSSNTNGYYYLSKAAAVGDNIIISRNDFEKIYAQNTSLFLYIEGPLWQRPCEPMTELDAENCYPIKTNNYWHDGIHLQSAEGFRSIGSGRLVAARNADVAGEGEEAHGSGSFALVRYQLPVSEAPFFYALYMHLKTVDLKSELKTFMETGSVSELLRGTWYEQIFNNLLPRYKIFTFSLPENFSGGNYNAIYEGKITEDGIFMVKVNEESPQKEKVLVNFGDGANESGILSRHMKAYLLPVNKFRTVCDIESYSDAKNLRFMVAKDTEDTDFKSSDGYYFFYCGNGSGRKLCCCKNEKINSAETFASSYNIYNEASYSYYVKKLYSLYKGEVVSFPEIKSDPTFQETKSDTKDYITTSSILAKNLIDYKSDVLEYGFSLGNKIVGITDSYSRIKSDAEQLACDIVQLLDLYSNTGDKEISKSFEQMMKNYVKERKKQIENLLYSITKKIDEKNEPLNGFRSSIKTDKEWMLTFYHDAERKLNVKEILGIEDSYVPKRKDINNVEYNDIRKPFEGILDKYKEYDVISVVAICEYLMIKFVSIPQKDIAGRRDDRFVYRDSGRSKTITSLFKIWEESLNSEEYPSLKSAYKDFFNERYIDRFIEIPKGAKIGYGSKIPDSGRDNSIHFELFSKENVLSSEFMVVEDTDEDNFYNPSVITEHILSRLDFTEQEKEEYVKYAKDNILLNDEIKKIYAHFAVFQNLVTRHKTEWAHKKYTQKDVEKMLGTKRIGHNKDIMKTVDYCNDYYEKYSWYDKKLFEDMEDNIMYFYHPATLINFLFSELTNKYILKIQSFSSKTAVEQYEIMSDIVNDSILSDKERGILAAEMRKKRNAMKLDELFDESNSEKYNFMNEDLREFLNLKEDGTMEYDINTIKKDKNWKKMFLGGTVFHQHNRENGFNVKYVNNDGREVVFKANGNMIMDYPDKGTYNYCNGNFFTTLPGGNHDKYDVKPFKTLEKRGF